MTVAPLNYDFVTPAEIHFGWGRRVEAASIARWLGRRAFIASGARALRSAGVLSELENSLTGAGIESIELTEIHREPLVEDVDAAAEKLRGFAVRDGDFIIAIGGGSAIDLGKAVAALAANADGASVKDFLEGVGVGRKIERPPLPLLAMPTTAGTGSEATKNSVISSLDPPFKKSLRADLMMPRAVLVDPALAVSLPASVTASTGMDAITQLIESSISRRAKPIPRAIALQGLQLALPALPIAVREPGNRAAREAMAHAALLSGMALANAGLGMAHGVAAALGVHCNVAHGLACAVMLPATLRVNRDVAAADLAQLERAVSCGQAPINDRAAADAFIHRIEALCSMLNIPARLSALGVAHDQIPAIVAGSRGNSMDGNPRPIDGAELTEILENIL